MGGDLSLIQNVQMMNEIQSFFSRKKNKNESAEVWRRLESLCLAMKENCFPAIFHSHHRDTPVAKGLKTLIQVITLERILYMCRSQLPLPSLDGC